MRLQDKNMIVTGGASGIGLATVRRCLREGANVVLSDLPDSEGAARARALEGAGGRCLFMPCDVRSTQQVDALVADAARELGSVDIVFANAGIGGLTPATELADDDWLRTIDINLNGVFRTARAALRQMVQQGSGSIINCASILGTLGQSGTAAYSAAKGGVVNLTRTLAIEGRRAACASTRSGRATSTPPCSRTCRPSCARRSSTCTPSAAWAATRKWPTRCCFWPATKPAS